MLQWNKATQLCCWMDFKHWLHKKTKDLLMFLAFMLLSSHCRKATCLQGKDICQCNGINKPMSSVFALNTWYFLISQFLQVSVYRCSTVTYCFQSLWLYSKTIRLYLLEIITYAYKSCWQIPYIKHPLENNTDLWLNCPNLFIRVGFINAPVTSYMMLHIICTPRAYF